MKQILKEVLEIIESNNLIQDGDKIICGVSGGPDSMCLLDILRTLKEKRLIDFNIIIAHINHMIREEAEADENFVREYAKKYNIPFYSKKINVIQISKEKKIGTEEAGRNVRYEYFAEVMQKTGGTKIATAHTKCDNAETVLMNIIRGAGLTGLCGIQAKRDEIFIRPLINIKRNEIEKYCEENNLNPRIDITNKETIYTRNKVRNILIPLLEKEFSPNIIETLDRLSRYS